MSGGELIFLQLDTFLFFLFDYLIKDLIQLFGGIGNIMHPYPGIPREDNQAMIRKTQTGKGRGYPG